MDINTLFITEAYLKANSTVGDNTDSNYIVPAIKDAQLLNLQSLIGTKLYNKMADLISSGDISQTQNATYKELLDAYISPYLVQMAQNHLLLNLMAKERNAGVVSYYDNNQQQMGLADVKYIRQEFANKGYFYAERITSFLHAHHNEIPEYLDHECGEMPHKDASYGNLNLKINHKRR